MKKKDKPIKVPKSNDKKERGNWIVRLMKLIIKS